MQLSMNLSSLLISTLLTGLTAGLCFTWGNAVTPGIGRLQDLGFLQAFQEMNRAILNPIFIIIFMGPFFLHLSNVYLFRAAPSQLQWMIMTAASLYIIGLVLVTIVGNVPLNEMIDKVDLTQLSADELKTLRNQFEQKWNRFHLIRTLTSILSFVLLIISIVLHTKNI